LNLTACVFHWHGNNAERYTAKGEKKDNTTLATPMVNGGQNKPKSRYSKIGIPFEGLFEDGGEVSGNLQ
jgi:hypothetical protein